MSFPEKSSAVAAGPTISKHAIERFQHRCAYDHDASETRARLEALVKRCEHLSNDEFAYRFGSRAEADSFYVIDHKRYGLLALPCKRNTIVTVITLRDPRLKVRKHTPQSKAFQAHAQRYHAIRDARVQAQEADRTRRNQT